MLIALPQRTRLYRNHHMDSTRWDPYVPRDDDIIIATSYKSGTTWTQNIVRELIVHAMHQTGAPDPDHLPPPDTLASPWVDARWNRSLDELYGRIETQSHRRFLKTHLALDGLPYFPQVKYLVVARDPRDVFMSIWNHYAAYTEHFYRELNEDPERPGPPCPRCPDDIHVFWRDWIGQGWFDWEEEGYPFWGNMHHTQTWWQFRNLDNICLLHYGDMLADPAGNIRRIARFLDIDLAEPALHAIRDHTSLPAMRRRALAREQEREGPEIMRGGARTFFNKGTNGRWRDVLTQDELVMYEATKSRVLTPDCARWLEQGESALL